MRNLTREVGNKTWVSGGQETIPLPRDYAYVDIMVELYAKITIAGANAAEVLADNAPAQLLRTIEIRANGRDVIKSLDFAGLIRLTQLRYGTAPNHTVLASAANQANTECYIYAIIPQAMWRAVKPFDTVFNSRPLSTYEAILTFGTVADIYTTAGAATWTVVSAAVYLSSREAVGLPDDAILPINKEATIESVVTATATEHKIPLNYAKDLQYRALVLRAHDAGCLSNAIINNIKLQSGGVIFYTISGRRTRNRNKLMYSIEAMPTGYYAIDFCEDGRLGDSLDTSGLSSLDLILDVTVGTGTTKVKVYTTEVILPTVVK